jgi:hypothetical protein
MGAWQVVACWRVPIRPGERLHLEEAADAVESFKATPS